MVYACELCAQIDITARSGESFTFGHLGLWQFCATGDPYESQCEMVRSGGVCDDLNFLKPYFRSYCNRVNYVTGLLVCVPARMLRQCVCLCAAEHSVLCFVELE